MSDAAVYRMWFYDHAFANEERLEKLNLIIVALNAAVYEELAHIEQYGGHREFLLKIKELVGEAADVLV